MDLSELVRVVRARWRTVLVLMLVCVAAAAGATVAITPTYDARAQMFVAIQSAELNTASQLQGGLFAAERVKSYPDIVRSPMVTEPVIEELGLSLTADQLADKISATVPTGTVLLDVVVRDEAPVAAAQMANAVSARFVDVVEELERSAATGQSAVQVEVFREAAVPTGPAWPKPPLNIGLGVLVGLALGVGAALYREATDVTVKGPDDVQQAAELGVIGAVGFEQGSSGLSLLAETDSLSPRGEAFRHIRTNLQFVDVDSPPRTLVVTSPLPTEGKSFTAANLALSLAQDGSRVCLVDADLRRPTVAKAFNAVGDVGLTSAIAGQVELDDVIQKGLGGIDLITSGPIPPNPAELLRSRQTKSLIAELAKRYDHVIIDTPPLLPVTDASVVAAGADATILVVRSHKTTKQSLRHAVENLASVNAHVIGAILSMVPGGLGDEYGYAYTYTYTYRPVGETKRRGLFRR